MATEGGGWVDLHKYIGVEKFGLSIAQRWEVCRERAHWENIRKGGIALCCCHGDTHADLK